MEWDFSFDVVWFDVGVDMMFGLYYRDMILTMREQVVIKQWNTKGLAGLRVSTLALLENIGGGDGGESGGVMRGDGGDGGVAEVLIRHTFRMLPQGLWNKAEGYCREICFMAGVEFDLFVYMSVMNDEEGEREDVEFDD